MKKVSKHQRRLTLSAEKLRELSRPLTDQPVPGSVKHLHFELVLALQAYKAHRRPRRSLRDPLGVAIVRSSAP